MGLDDSAEFLGVFDVVMGLANEGGDHVCQMLGALVGDAADTSIYRIHGHVGFMDLGKAINLGRVSVVGSYAKFYHLKIHSL